MENEGGEFYRAALNNKGCWHFFFLDINTITHREKPIREESDPGAV